MILFGNNTYIINESFVVWYDALNNRVNVDGYPSELRISYEIPSDVNGEKVKEEFAQRLYEEMVHEVKFINLDSIFVDSVEFVGKENK